jgi:hypothetical protein
VGKIARRGQLGCSIFCAYCLSRRLSTALLAYPGSTLVNLMCRVEQEVVRGMLATKRSRNSKGKYPDKNGNKA